jgi:2-amino-4-hydroxy-6-hydroxymethyldihydropteridine diphosphokinase
LDRQLKQPETVYLIALGSNQRHLRFGLPPAVIKAAIRAIAEAGVTVVGSSPSERSRPLGPSLRTYANAVAIVRTRLEPPELLALCKQIEREFGLRRKGARWRARVLDLDLILWTGGIWASPELGIPHRDFRTRNFVLNPANSIAGRWRDPISGCTVRQLKKRLDKKSPE